VDYKEFLKSKQLKSIPSGFSVDRNSLNPILFDYQKDLICWALELGRASVFANTGLGKGLMLISYAQKVYEKTNKNVIILAPLGVTYQLIHEAKEKFNLNINNYRNNGLKKGLNICNYEQLKNINPIDFGCLVADEIGIIKNFAGKIRNQLITMFDNYQYKLGCSATPSPNDYMELGNHSEFMNVLKRKEMLSMFFVHDGGETQKWRLKKHAYNDFWKWISTWGAVVVDPSDLGYNDDRFVLPKLIEKEIKIDSDKKFGNYLFSVEAETLQERREARKVSLPEKINVLSEIVNNSNEIHLVWGDLNIECEMARKAIKDSVEIKGSDKDDYKEKMMFEFAKGNIKTLISKPKIAGHGMNFQVCNNSHFIGLSDSFEAYFQAVRRNWRFGQKKDVTVRIYTSNLEGSILRNIRRKEVNVNLMLDELRKNTQKYLRENISHHKLTENRYVPTENIILPDFLRSVS
jgi:superfamily II DNA or RNA helicase